MTSAEVARVLGVGPTSVKRWADSGILPCLRTPGRHRRFARQEVERFRLRQQEVQAPDPAQVEAWIKLLESDCGPYEVHSALLFDRSRLGSWWQTAELVGAVLSELGERWSRGTLSVLDEHLASERLARGLARCAESIATATVGPRALLVSATGDEHTLGLQLAELCLREVGWGAWWAGRSIPAQDVLDRIRQGGCDMVALSAAASSSNASELERQILELGPMCAEHEIELVVGGNGAWPEPSPNLPRFHRVKNFRELHELLKSVDG